MVDARVANVVARHERSLMRVARQWSLCRDDALDAYQRALEIYVRRIDSVDPVTEISWLRVVVKHEALAVRRLRAESVTAEDIDLDGHAPETQRPVDELLAARERVSRGAEALRAAEAGRGEGADAQGRGTLVQGDQRPVRLDLYEDEPRDHRRSRPVPQGLRGDRDRRGVRARRAHARGPRRWHGDRRRPPRAPAPPAALHDLPRDGPQPPRVPPRSARGALADPRSARAARWVQGRIGASTDPTTVVPQLERAGDDDHPIVLSPVEGIPDLPEAVRRIDLPDPSELVRHERLFDLKSHLFHWWHRLQGSDVATTAQIAAANSGGGRIATIGAIVGLCLSGVGAGTVCVVSGVIDNPFAPTGADKTLSDSGSPRVPPRRAKSPRSAHASPTPVPAAMSSPDAKRQKVATRKKDSVDRERQNDRKADQEHAPASVAPSNAAPSGASELDPSYKQASPPPPAPSSSSAGGTRILLGAEGDGRCAQRCDPIHARRVLAVRRESRAADDSGPRAGTNNSVRPGAGTRDQRSLGKRQRPPERVLRGPERNSANPGVRRWSDLPRPKLPMHLRSSWARAV